MKIVLDKAAADLLTARTVAAIKQAGHVAEKIGDAASELTKAADESAKVRPALRAMGAAAWSSLLARVFGR